MDPTEIAKDWGRRPHRLHHRPRSCATSSWAMASAAPPHRSRTPGLLMALGSNAPKRSAPGTLSPTASPTAPGACAGPSLACIAATLPGQLGARASSAAGRHPRLRLRRLRPRRRRPVRASRKYPVVLVVVWTTSDWTSTMVHPLFTGPKEVQQPRSFCWRVNISLLCPGLDSKVEHFVFLAVR